MTDQDLLPLSTVDVDSLENRLSDVQKEVVFVFSCGYEKRSIAQYLKFKSIFPEGRTRYLAFSFTTFKESKSRPENEAIVRADNIDPVELQPSDSESAWTTLENVLSSYEDRAYMLLVDYSSMPRNWYCELGEKMIRGAMGEDVTFLYTTGKYSEEEYPCVGYGEFHRFSGRPNITSTKEINLGSSEKLVGKTE